MSPPRSRHRHLLALAMTVMLAACARGAAPSVGGSGRTPTSTSGAGAFPVTIVDDDGVKVSVDAAPRRIVTFAPSATEIVFALGLGDRLVGVSGRYDDYPPAAKGIEQVGGAGDFGVDPNVEKVVSLRPDLFLTIAGGEQWKDRLRSLGVPVFTINSTGLEDVFHDIQTVGRLTGAVSAAGSLVAKMRAVDRDVEGRIAGEPSVSCFFEVYYPPLTTVGPDTFIGDLLRRAGCRSVSVGAKSDYPQWSVEDLVREDPRVYLVSSESGAGASAIARRPGFDAIGAITAGRIVRIDADLVNRPGPRVVDGLRLLARALHPGAFG
jgi:iron complex transport system substrate-binding protein